MTECSCPRLALGLQVTEARNWNPDCPEHGIESPWWHSEEQRAERAASRSRLLELQRRAREARKRAGSLHSDHP